MPYTRVKICGITRTDDALAAIASGVDAIGFVFYKPSPRDVSAETTQSMIKQLPAFVTFVGLFVNENVEAIADIARKSGINCIQLHGDESPAFCDEVAAATALPVIKAIRVDDDGVFYPAHPNEYESVQSVLLDTYSKTTAGGTGNAFNWDFVPVCDKAVILAGGLRSDNVQAAIEDVQPYAVDVSGGVEQEGKKGIKDYAKIEAFISNVKSVR